MIRLNKFISECGFASRRKVEEFILQGRIEINGKVVTELGVKVDPVKDVISLDGERIRVKQKVYLVLNKPKGYITSTDDEKHRKTVLDLINYNTKIFPVGRLDYNTTGVLLLTNDGDFTNLLLHPNNKVPRIYKVSLSKPLSEKDKDRLEKGILLDGKRGRFEEVRVKKGPGNTVTVKTVEGRNHFVKNMFKSLGYLVTELSRISYAGITVQGMAIGGWREMTPEEIKAIYKTYAKE